MGVYKKRPKKIIRLRISDIEKLMFYYRQKYITVFYGFIRCNKVIIGCKHKLFFEQILLALFFINVFDVVLAFFGMVGAVIHTILPEQIG